MALTREHPVSRAFHVLRDRPGEAVPTVVAITCDPCDAGARALLVGLGEAAAIDGRLEIDVSAAPEVVYRVRDQHGAEVAALSVSGPDEHQEVE